MKRLRVMVLMHEELVPPDDHEASRASAGLSALLPPAGLDEVS